MKVNIYTKTLQELAMKIDKASLATKNQFISNYVQIETSNGILKMQATDLDNHVIVFGTIEDKSNFKALVSSNTFCKLVATLNKDYVTLELDGTNVVLTEGKSCYKFVIPLNEIGEPLYLTEVEIPKKGVEIDPETLSDVLTYLPSAVSKDFTNPVLTSYCIADKAYSSNRFKVCVINKKLLEGLDNILLPGKLVSLLDLIEDSSSIKYFINEFGIFFITNSVVIVGLDMKSNTPYPKEAIDKILKEDSSGSFLIKKDELKLILSRLSLFVEDNDKSVILISFTKTSMKLSNTKNSGVDEVPIEWEKEDLNWSNKVDFKFLLNLIEVMDSEIKFDLLPDKIRLSDRKCENILTLIKE